MKSIYQKSQYDHMWNVSALEAEAKRLSLLPTPSLNADTIMRWRRKQVHLIGQRIREIARDAQNRGA